MKQLIIILILSLSGAMASTAQTSYTTDASGVLVQQKTIHTEAEAIGKGTASGQQFKATDGKLYPVYTSPKGRLYIVRTAKSGNHYKVYIDEAQK